MAIVLQGFLGPFTGKVGGAVGGIWKGINYIKGYVVPANPNTPAQQAQRTKFRVAVLLAQAILGDIIADFWNPIAVKMSGYNFFMQQFLNLCESTGLANVNCIFSKGSLEDPQIDSCVYDTATGTATVAWDNTPVGNGEATDSMAILLVNKTDNSVLGYSKGFSTRDDASEGVVIAAGLTATNILAYCWAYRGTGSTFTASNSTAVLGEAA